MYVKYQVIGRNHVAVIFLISISSFSISFLNSIYYSLLFFLLQVPTHFFKVIVTENANRDLALESYVMPNAVIDDNTPLSSFLVPIETVERAAGLLFFDKLSLEKLKTINGKNQVWI